MSNSHTPRFPDVSSPPPSRKTSLSRFASQVFCSPGISSRELFGPIRGVCGNWMRAVDAMPCAAARREVAKVCAGELVGDGSTNPLSEGKGKAGSGGSSNSNREVGNRGGAESDGRTGKTESQEEGLEPNVPSSRNTPDGGRGSDPVQPEQGPSPGSVPGVGGVDVGVGGRQTQRWWDTVRARLVRGGGFTECAAEDLLARLEWAAELEDDGDGGDLGEGGGTVGSAIETGTHGDDVADATVDDSSSRRGGDGNGCGRRRRMLRHLEATRALCEEWGLLAGRGHAGKGGGGASGSGSWSGWEAFGLAVATSASRDRLSLCCWAVRPLLGADAFDGDSGGGGKGRRRRGPLCPGLPRGEVIELLCLMLCALRSLEGEEGSGGGVGGGGGFVRLKVDVLVCARVLENWDVR